MKSPKPTTFLDLVRESVISQLLLTLLVVGGTFVTYNIQGHVPDWMMYSCVAIVGFFFGSKVTNTVNKLQNEGGNDGGSIANRGSFADSVRR